MTPLRSWQLFGLIFLFGCVAQTNGAAEGAKVHKALGSDPSIYAISRPVVQVHEGSTIVVRFEISNPTSEDICVDELDTYQISDFPAGPQEWLARNSVLDDGVKHISAGKSVSIVTVVDLYDVVDFYDGAVQIGPAMPRYDKRRAEEFAEIDDAASSSDFIHLRGADMLVRQYFDLYICGTKHRGRDSVANLRTDLSDVFVLPKQ